MADLEKLNIVIAGNAKEATDSIDGLIQKLGSAKTATGGLNAITTSTQKLKSAVADTSEEVKENAGVFREAKDVVSRYYQILTKVASDKNDVSLTNEGYVSASGRFSTLAEAANSAAERFENLGDIMSELNEYHFSEVDQRSIRSLEDYSIKIEEMAEKQRLLQEKMAEQAAKEAEQQQLLQEKTAEKQRLLQEKTAKQESVKAFAEAKKIVTDYYSALEKLAKTNNDVAQSGKWYISLGEEWEGLATRLNEVSRKYENLNSIMDKLSPEDKARLTEYMKDANQKYGVVLDEVANKTKAVKEETEKLSDAVAKTTEQSGSRLSKLMGTIKRVATMRLIRWAIRQVVTAAKEGLEILVEWDKTFGNNTSYAAKTVDELSAKWNEVKKSVGAAIMPLIQILQPALNFIMNAVITIANAFNQILRAAQGYSDYMKATYIKTDSTAKKAKELRRILFSFDELNVLNSNSGKDSANSLSPIEFDPTPIENAFKKIGKTAAKVWKGVKETVSDVWNSMKPGLEKAWDGVCLMAKGFKDGDWNTIWEGLKTVATGVWDAIVAGGQTLWEKVSPYLTPIVNWVVEHILNPIRSAVDEWTTKFANDHPFLAKVLGITAVKEREEKFKEFGIKFSATTSQDGATKGLINSPIVTEAGVYSATVNFTTKTKLDEDVKKVLGLVGSNLVNLGFDIAINAGRRASGGDPDVGTLFWAGEAGAEVVANTPSGTGVMNMKQMQDAVSNGNIQVVNALGAIGNMIVNAINSKDTNAYLDGAKITDDVLRRANGMARATGQAVLAR